MRTTVFPKATDSGPLDRDDHTGIRSNNIPQVLLELQSSGTLISISVEGLAGTYLSILLKADLQNGILLFDGLQSLHLDHQVEAGAIVTVNAKLGQNNITFDCIVESPFKLNKTAAFSAHFPSSLHITERRNAYRVKIPAAMTSSIVQLTTTDGPYQGRLLDISRQGAAALLPARINSAVGSRVACAIRLLDSQLDTNADVRSASEQNGHQRLGLLFADLSAIEHKRIDASIATLERIVLRGYARTRAR